jgi:hypothetical protein
LYKRTEKTEELLGFKMVLDNKIIKEACEKNRSGKNLNV